MEITPISTMRPLLGPEFIPSRHPASGLPEAGAGSTTPAHSFGAAFVRESQPLSPTEEASLYGADARLLASGTTTGTNAVHNTALAAETNTANALESRDKDVRRQESAQGEPIAGSNFNFPDSERYTVGTTGDVGQQDGGDLTKRQRQDQAQSVSQGKEFGAVSQEEQALLDKLQARDAKVRQHEAAHIVAGGGQVQGAPTYEYQLGPDGRRYAIGGSVNISIKSFSGDPEESARQARVAYRAAMATGDPSSQDMLVANRATELSSRARHNALENYSRQMSAEAPEENQLEAVA